MKLKRMHDLLEEHDGHVSFDGVCHDCSAGCNIHIRAMKEGITITGGSVYEPEHNKFFLKCDKCFQEHPLLENYQDCEVYARVVGYLRPVAQWNPAKKAEFKDRTMYKLKGEQQ